MQNRESYISILQSHMPEIKGRYEVSSLCLFGSVARGDNNSGSDVDILVEMPPKLLVMSSLKIYLESILKTSVDLIRKHSHLSPSFLLQVSKDGINIT